jgi:predicted ATPase/class 3 adenylate cyclase
MRRELPSGTVTLLFTDVEGSTRLLRELGADAYAQALQEHRHILRQAAHAHGGLEVNTQGDSFLIAFSRATDAAAAAAKAQQALAAGPIRVRMGLHTGEPLVRENDYVGLEVHRGARIAAAAHGGQVVLSRETGQLLDDSLPIRDLGEHRVKDFAEPVWIFQLGDQAFPPLKTISNTNLPKPASSFVGRDREVGEVVALLQGGARLVTLIGPGGIGKTRLAIEAASELVPEHRNGVFWVSLAPLRDPALVVETIGQTLGAKDGVAAHIGDREILLLLDNFEQVVESAPDLPALLETCPNLQVLVTSRERLRVRGEVDYAVLPLPGPEAIDLFCTRARVEPDATVTALCRLLDNLPLALELAAARTRVLSPAQILERVSHRLDLLKGGRDAEARQRTLRATIEWSHDLLTAEEQRLFAALSVFAGGCTLEAVEAVTNADLDTLESLLDKSLLRRREERFWMLETIREFATEHLEGSVEAVKVRRRHAEHFLALAEEAQPHLRGSPKEWLDRLQRDHDNFRAAFDWLESAGESQLVLRLTGALWRFWVMRGHPAEGRRRLEAALRADERPTAARASALDGAGVVAMDLGGDPTAARHWAEEALALHRALGESWGIAHSGLLLGGSANEEGDFTRALPFLEEAVRTFRDLGDEHYTALATMQIAWACEELGDLERSRALRTENLRRAQGAGNQRMEAMSLEGLAWHARMQGRVEESLALLRESTHIVRDLSDPVWMANILSRFAATLVVGGRAEAAAQLLSKSTALYAEIGSTIPRYVGKRNEETLIRIHAGLDADAFADAWARGRALTLEEALDRAGIVA